ncbi:hypothetical protein LCGC14_2992430 [marine sediment metagenome]|uniref:Uncharacterized protein n=1 Tax=marine sediment metagenome TaxID=412755 RepID=A0A0F8X3C8_9ZZZZ
MEFKFELGTTLRDKVTGFEGVVMVRAEYFTGCVHYGLQTRELKDGRITDWEWIDGSRLILVDGLTQITKEGKPTSGPHPNGPQM